MSTHTRPDAGARIVYPDSDGQPMAENTLQYEWITTIKGGLDALFADRPDVFVAGDLLWYPVEGDNTTRTAPDALVAFGRPKGSRGSYMQWVEGGIAPQVVFEVLSPGNRAGEMKRKFEFYERFGVEEYYLYDPETGALSGYQRQGGRLTAIPRMIGWVSPRLGVRFDLDGVDLVLTGPDGRRFLSYVEQCQRAEAAQREADAARHESDAVRRLAEATRQESDAVRRLAEATRQESEAVRRLADAARHEADESRRRAERLEARLRALGIDPEEEDGPG